MAESTYSKFKKYILFEEEFIFIVSLYMLLNEKHEVKNSNGEKFIMSYQNFKKYLRKLRKMAANSCGIVCFKDEMCPGHQVLKIMNEYEDFIQDSVENKTLFYKNVKFEKVFDDSAPMFGFILKPLDEMDIGWKSWSQRLQYLN